MARIKKGDNVVFLKHCKVPGREDPNWNRDMAAVGGKVGTVTGTSHSRKKCWIVQDPKGKLWEWHEKWLKKEEKSMAKKKVKKELYYGYCDYNSETLCGYNKKETEGWIDSMIDDGAEPEDIYIFPESSQVKFKKSDITLEV